MKVEKMTVKHFVVPVLLLLCLASSNSSSPTTTDDHHPNQILSSGKKHYVLIHGARHGAWCWYKLATLLTSHGHNVTTLDLAASGINPVQAEQVHSFSDYVAPLMKFMKSLAKKERVILVGHSVGGAVISIAMEKFPEKVAAAVFATALMPGPSISYTTIHEKIKERQKLTHHLEWLPSMYQLSPPEDRTLALSLVRSWGKFNDEEIELTNEKYGSVPRVFIVCDQDLTIEKDLQMWMIKENPPNEVKVINGSDHMVMFSRPLSSFSTSSRMLRNNHEKMNKLPRIFSCSATWFC